MSTPSTPAFSLADLPALQKQVHLEAAGRSRVLLGSQLGTLIKRAAWVIGRDINFRTFGGLKAFATNYLREQLKITPGAGPGGNDDVYELITPRGDSSSQAASILEEGAELGSTSSFWWAFSNPGSELVVVVDRGCDPAVLPASEVIPSEKRQLKKIDATDYFQWAQEYTDLHMADAERQAARNLLSTKAPADFSNTWYTLISGSPNRYHLKRWEQFRIDRVFDAFRARLGSMGCPPSKIAELTALLSASRSAKRQMAPNPGEVDADQGARTTAATTPTSSEPTARATEELTELRRILHLAVDRLSADQLKAISIPAGILIEVQSRSAH